MIKRRNQNHKRVHVPQIKAAGSRVFPQTGVLRVTPGSHGSVYGGFCLSQGCNVTLISKAHMHAHELPQHSLAVNASIYKQHFRVQRKQSYRFLLVVCSVEMAKNKNKNIHKQAAVHGCFLVNTGPKQSHFYESTESSQQANGCCCC